MTYSIVAQDPETGELGVAVQSHWFSVGPIVPWARARESEPWPRRPTPRLPTARGLWSSWRRELSAAEALAQLLVEDPPRPAGRWRSWTPRGRGGGAHRRDCIAFAGHVVGEGVSCQANIMVSEQVWPAMLAAFKAAGARCPSGCSMSWTRRSEAGGDLRGQQSAALLVVGAEGEPWETTVSLRVEDDPDPLTELRRLLGVHQAYRLAGEADELVGQGRHDEAAGLYEQASALAPGNHELRLWAGLGAAQGGDLPLAVAEVRAAIAAHPPWRDLLARLPAQVAPSASTVLAALDSAS